MASVRSLDNALVTGTGAPIPGAPITDDFGVTQIPDNGRLMRNLIEGADLVMSNITHFYHLSALDFVDATNLGPFFSPSYTNLGATNQQMIPGTFPMANTASVVANYVEALTMRRKCHTMGAILSGKQPHQNAIVPGGVTTLPSASDMANFDTLLNDIRDFINTAYVPDVLTVAVTAPTAFPALFGGYTNYWTTTGSTSAISYGIFPCQTGTTPEQLLIARGWITGTALQTAPGIGPTALLNQVIEDTTYSYYNQTTQGLHPHSGQTNPDVSMVGDGTHYSWLKAPRIGPAGAGQTVAEVGPLARMVVSFYAENAAPGTLATDADGTGAQAVPGPFAGTFAPLAALTNYSAHTIVNAAVTLLGTIPLGPTNLYSTFGRHACRMLETKLIADAMKTWSARLQSNLTGSSYIYAKLPTKPARGSGWTEAPRGALGHWITIEKKKIVNYQCVVPTTWNHSPMDSQGFNGPAEQVIGALNVGTGAVSTDQQVVNIIRALHPFDFCIACAVHMVKPDGSTIAKFSMDMDGKVTKIPHDVEI